MSWEGSLIASGKVCDTFGQGLFLIDRPCPLFMPCGALWECFCGHGLRPKIRPCPRCPQTLPNGSEQGTEGGRLHGVKGWGRLHGVKGCMGSRDGAVSSGSRDDPRSPADLDGQAGGFELGEAAGLVLFCGGREGERFRVVGGAQALVLAFADVVVGKEIHFVGLAV